MMPHAQKGRTALPLDEFDARLLRAVQGFNRLGADEIAAAVGLSPSACLRRLRDMRQSGVIMADVAVVSPAAVGRPITLVVDVTLEREQPALIEAFKSEMRSRPEVMICLYVTGEIDFVLLVSARTMEEYETFTQQCFFANPNIRRFHTHVVMDRVKLNLAVPIDIAG